MASSSSIKAGEAFIIIRATDATAKTLAEIGSRFERFGRSVRNIGLAFGGVGGAIMAAFIKPVKNAMKVQEEMNQFFNVFGTTVGKNVEAQLVQLGKETGRSSKRMYGYAANFGKIIRGYGATTKAAGEMTSMLVELGVDFSSFNDIMDDTREGSMGRFKSALSGSAEVLDQFGVAAKESALGPALKKMFGVGTRSATELQKATARTFLIWQSMQRQNAIGDAVRTVGDLANQMRNFKDLLFSISVSIGTALLKPLEGIMKIIFKVGYALEAWIDNHQDIVRLVAVIGASIAAVGAIFLSIGVTIQAIGWTLMTFAKLASVISTVFTVVGAVVGFILGNFWILLSVILWITAAVLAWKVGLFEIFDPFLGWIKSVGGSIWKAFSAGRIKLAWDIFFKALQIGWNYIASLANNIWSAWASFGIRAWSEIITFALTIISRLKFGFQRLWFDVQTDAYKTWGQIFSWLADKFEWLGMKNKAEFLRVAADTAGNYAEIQKETSNIINGMQITAEKKLQAAKEAYLKTWDEDQKRNLSNWDDEAERLRREMRALQKEAEKPLEEKVFPDPEDEKRADNAGKVMKDILPAALEKGTSAAARKAYENQRAQHVIENRQRDEIIKANQEQLKMMQRLALLIGTV